MKLLLNAFLAFLARVLFIALALPGFIISLIIAKDKSRYFLRIAISYDQLGNTVLGPLFNVTLKKKGGYYFGNPDETISFILGQNKKRNRLTRLGRWIADLLNKIDPNHVEDAKS